MLLPYHIIISSVLLITRPPAIGAGQQCCYDAAGNLLTGSPGGGSADFASQKISVLGHYRNDELPFLLCCKAGTLSRCDDYYLHRPSGPADEPPPPPG